MKIEKVSDEGILFDNGSTISFSYSQSCCEVNYADFKQIEEAAMEYEFAEQLIFEKVDRSGFRFGSVGTPMFFIPCYSEQNGFYSFDIDVEFNGNMVLNVECEWGEYDRRG